MTVCLFQSRPFFVKDVLGHIKAAGTVNTDCAVCGESFSKALALGGFLYSLQTAKAVWFSVQWLIALKELWLKKWWQITLVQGTMKLLMCLPSSNNNESAYRWLQGRRPCIPRITVKTHSTLWENSPVLYSNYKLTGERLRTYIQFGVTDRGTSRWSKSLIIDQPTGLYFIGMLQPE